VRKRVARVARQDWSSLLSSFARVVDAALWFVARQRHRRFDGAIPLISRFKEHEVLPVATRCSPLDAHLERFLATTREEEYLLSTTTTAVLEPRYGFVFLSPTRVLFESLNPKNSRWNTARASATSLLKADRNRRGLRVLNVPSVLSLRDFNEDNLWHFVNDVFPKVLLAEEAGVPSHVPAVIGHRLANLKFFPAVEAAICRHRPVLVQDEETFIRADTIYCGVSLNNDITRIDSFLDAFHDIDPSQSVMPDDAPASSQRADAVFVTRSARRPRRVTNIAEIHHICEDVGLEVVDFDDLSFGEAEAVMRRSQTIVGLHGAGLTNVMFRRGLPTRIGEVVMEDHVGAEYFMLARHWGFTYRGMLGQRVANFDGKPAYFVDPSEFEAMVRTILEAEPTSNETVITRRSYDS
jgi:hypothetical protein